MDDFRNPYSQPYEPDGMMTYPPSSGPGMEPPTEKPRKQRHTWAWIYGSLLTAYTTFTLLNVFVIPHDTVKVDQSAAAEIYQSTTIDSLLNQTDSGDQTKTGSVSKGDTIADAGEISGSNRNTGDTGDSEDNEVSGDTGGDTEIAGISENDAELLDAEITATETGYIYRDKTMTITLTQSYRDDTMIYIADIQLSSIATLKSGLADDSFGRNLKEKTSDIADRVGAILAINGDYYGFRDTGYVIRNGILYRNTMRSQTAQDLVIYEDGSMEIITEGEVTAEELLERGALQVYSFGPGLVIDGEITVDAGTEVKQSMTSNPRTAIGCISPLHYVMVVSDGRTDESEGLSLLQLAEVMKELGCEQAYNLDGGGSTTMYFNGEIINNPTTNGNKVKERSVSDIVYIGY